MAFLPAALAIGGSLFSGVSALGQANYQSQVARRNAVIAGQNANLSAQQQQVQSQRQDREMAALEGQQMAAQSASGLDVLGASQLATRATTRRARNEGALDIARQGEARTASYFNQQAGYLGEANAYKSKGISEMIGSVFDAAAGGINNGVGKSLIGKPKSRRFGQ